MRQIYLDWAATAPIDPVVLEELIETQRELFGNPNSLHSTGREASRVLENSRHRFAELLDVDTSGIHFTSGGSEANAIVLLSLLRKKRRGRVLISSIEHPAVYEYIAVLRDAGFDVREIPCDGGGFIRPEAVEKLLSVDTRLVSVMTLNNETGSLQDIAGIARSIRSFEEREGCDIHLHSDAVQALGKLPLDLDSMDVDSAAFSGHKLSAPKGIGALYLRTTIEPLLVGGGQEGGIRPGTQNVPAVHAFVRAAERRIEHIDSQLERVAGMQRSLVQRLAKIDGVRLLPADSDAIDARESLRYSPYILSFTTSPLPGEVLLRVLNDRGLAVSSGSACSSRQMKKRGRVLEAMGVEEKSALGAVRISFGWSTTEEEVKRAGEILEETIPEFRKTVL